MSWRLGSEAVGRMFQLSAAPRIEQTAPGRSPASAPRPASVHARHGAMLIPAARPPGSVARRNLVHFAWYGPRVPEHYACTLAEHYSASRWDMPRRIGGWTFLSVSP